MKTRLPILILLFAFSLSVLKVNAQSIQLSTELKELIDLSLNKDFKVVEKDIEKKITEIQRKSVRSAYLPKLELGGKYLYAYSTMNSNMGNIEGFENLSKLQELMKNPAFPVLFPNLAGIVNDLNKLQQFLATQGIELPTVKNGMDGDLSGNYFGVDLTAKVLLYSGGKVPNASKALAEKIKAQEAMSDKAKSDVINEVITYYDQLALLVQSKKVLDESNQRLVAEKKYAFTALKNGLATTFDTLKIAVADASLQAKLSDYESKKKLLFEKLAQLTGKPAPSFEFSNPDLQLLIYTDTISDITNRAEFRALTSSVEAQKYMLKSEKSHYLPKVQALATVRYDNIFSANANLTAPIPMGMNINNLGIGPTYMVGVGFKWELFDRSSGSAKVQQAKLEVMKADNAKEEARELLKLNQTKARMNYEASITQVAFKEKQRQAARMALQLAQKSYDEGMINITERLAAETDMQNADLEFFQAVFAQRQSALECYKATGSLVLSNIK